jgi:heat shock protein HslJ
MCRSWTARARTVSALTLALASAGCATGRGGQPPVLEGTTWRIVQVDGAEVRAPADVNMAPHFRILSAEGQVHGATGCNRFSGRYRADGASVAFGTLTTTGMACRDGALQDQEQRILDVLDAADGYRIDGRWLWLMTAGQHRMTLEVW